MYQQQVWDTLYLRSSVNLAERHLVRAAFCVRTEQEQDRMC